MLPVALALALMAAPAAAQSPDEATDALFDQGYYLGPGVSISESGVSDLVRDAANTGASIRLVVLDEEPPGGAPSFATAVLDRLGTGTVIVLTEDGFVGYDTAEFARGEVEAALDAADAAGGSDLAYLRNVVRTLTGAVAPTPTSELSEPAPAAGGGGGGSGLIFLLVIVAVIGLVIFFVVRSSRKTRKSELDRAREEIQSQLDAMANDVLDLADRVKVSEGAEARSHFEKGSATYSAATDAFDEAESLEQLEALSSQLDDAAWELDAAEAILEGEDPPPKPAKEAPARCFFDPTHRGPMEQAKIETSAGDRTVMVCRQDAERLRRGQRPDSRMIDVGGKRIPAARAPKSHGGLGMGGMDLLSILVGGMGQALPNVLNRGRRAPRRTTRASSRASSRSGRGPTLPSPSRRGSSPKPKSSSRSSGSRSRSRGGRRRRR